MASVEAELPDTLDLRPDGRSLRRERNRERVIRALVELIREGDHDPGAAAIADRAGVSHRSVFRYFDDLSDLVREVVRAEFAEIAEVARLDDIGVGALPDRIDRLVNARVMAYDALYEISKVAYRRRADIPAVDASLRQINGLIRTEFEKHFAIELDTMAADEACAALDLAIAITSFETFDLYRDVLGRSDEQIADRWRRALHLIWTAGLT